jgi:hypothetical protein
MGLVRRLCSLRAILNLLKAGKAEYQHHDCYVKFTSWDNCYVLVKTADGMHITLPRLRSGWLLKLNVISCSASCKHYA